MRAPSLLQADQLLPAANRLSTFMSYKETGQAPSLQREDQADVGAGVAQDSCTLAVCSADVSYC